MRSASSSLVTSAVTPLQIPPRAQARAAASSARSGVRSTTTTLAPTPASADPIADPIAPPPPGMRATRPSSLNLSSSATVSPPLIIDYREYVMRPPRSTETLVLTKISIPPLTGDVNRSSICHSRVAPCSGWARGPAATTERCQARQPLGGPEQRIATETEGGEQRVPAIEAAAREWVASPIQWSREGGKNVFATHPVFQ